MKLKHWVQYILFHDTTWHGQFKVLRPLLLGQSGFAPVVVDVGANDGFYSSNSYPFVKRGWKAVLLEPHPGAFAAASKLHSGNRQVTLLNLACSDKPGELPLILGGDEGGSHSTLDRRSDTESAGIRKPQSVSVKVEVLEKVLEEQNVPARFGLLTIDTEGHDFRVIQGLNCARFRPRVIITERNEDDEAKFDYLRQHSYQLHCTLEFDSIWTDTKLM
jgi:FkbM family methyltransferase